MDKNDSVSNNLPSHYQFIFLNEPLSTASPLYLGNNTIFGIFHPSSVRFLTLTLVIEVLMQPASYAEAIAEFFLMLSVWLEQDLDICFLIVLKH